MTHYSTVPLLLFVLLTISNVVLGIKFDLVATASNAISPKCISQYVSNGTLVVVTIKAGIGYNQIVDAEVSRRCTVLVK
jgi:hypothetical protein